jgi:glycosyltransferase involved in cell wall biosynthesis
MKVLFDHALPFVLAHGGFQIQIEETKAALERRGVEVEAVRWWDSRQTGDLIHYFGSPSGIYLDSVRVAGIPMVVTELFTAICNRPPAALALRGLVTRGLLALPGWSAIKNQLSWQSYRRARHLIVGLKAERRVLRAVYGVPEERISLVPLGLHRDFLTADPPARSASHLISTGTITSRKRSMELALMARAAQVPVLFVGKPYHLDDPYWKKFAALIDDRHVLYRSHVEDRRETIALLQSSRGFVIFSRYENWCLSAHEAAACGLPLLLPDQPWSRECFGAEASYLRTGSSGDNPALLRSFYEKSPGLSAPAINLLSWDDVADRLEVVYRSLVH